MEGVCGALTAKRVKVSPVCSPVKGRWRVGSLGIFGAACLPVLESANVSRYLPVSGSPTVPTEDSRLNNIQRTETKAKIDPTRLSTFGNLPISLHYIYVPRYLPTYIHRYFI